MLNSCTAATKINDDIPVPARRNANPSWKMCEVPAVIVVTIAALIG